MSHPRPLPRTASSLLPLSLGAALALAGCGGAPTPQLAEVDMSGEDPGDMCLSACGAECVDLQTDPRNCGACGTSCGAMESCRAGRCQGGPPPPPPDMTTPPPAAQGCAAEPPAGAPQAPPAPPYSGGTCPMLAPGKNLLKSTGRDRSFLLAVPKDLKPGEKLPVVFLWHWLGGSAQKFFDRAQIQAAVDQQRFLAIAPEPKSDMLFKWPFDVGITAARMEEEFRFFDDMLSCAEAQFNVNRNCVSSAGVSAGALFTDQLAGHRDKYLASAISLSGGVDSFAKPFGSPQHKLPFFVLYGGDKDTCVGIINFKTATMALEDALVKGGHFFLECEHNCGHAEPPFEGPMGMTKFAALWQFVFDHPYWLGKGASPYTLGGVPKDLPAWCGIGKGSAKQRTGACPDKPGC